MQKALIELLEIFLKDRFLKKKGSHWADVLPAKTKQSYKRIHSSTKLTPIEGSLKKKTEKYVYHKLLDQRKKVRPKFQVNDLVGTANLERTFSKGDRKNWSYKLYKITKSNKDTIPSYRIVNSKERHNESLLRKTELTKKENDTIMKKNKYHIEQIKLSLAIATHRR